MTNDQRPQPQTTLQKVFIVTIAVIVTIGATLFAVNQFLALSSSRTSDGSEVQKQDMDVIQPDDSGALEALGFSVGSLFKYVETYSLEECSFMPFVASQMRNATPLDTYRGTYESIVSDIESIGVLCPLDPSDPLVVDQALRARAKVVQILADRKWNGFDWANTAVPIPGAQK